jgi:hypothetical protein
MIHEQPLGRDTYSILSDAIMAKLYTDSVFIFDLWVQK